jgi:hypothetical protein
MVLNTEAKYPSRRTYVVKVCSEATSRVLAGRLENFVTGQRREFTTAGELVELILTDLAASEHATATERGRFPDHSRKPAQ